MKYILILLGIVLTGCSTTVPVTQKFPAAPQALLEECKVLKPVEKDSSLIDLTKVVVENYTEYYQCKETTSGWIEWYKVQKRIFEGLK
jgi:hypothetical protein